MREEEVWKSMGIGHSQELIAEPIRIGKCLQSIIREELVPELIG